MIWQIVGKEIHNNIMTLRFALIIILMLILMVVNALTYTLSLHGYVSEMDDYRSQLAQNLSWIERYSKVSLGELAMLGPGDEIPRLPRRLKFCADGHDEIIPRKIYTDEGKGHSYTGGPVSYSWRELWFLSYPPSGHRNIMSKLIKIDWVFIGVILSFGAILFTFDAISGERERGTLSLMLSNSVSRAQMLSGKFLGAFFCIMLPLLVSILINLLIINLSGAIPLDNSDWVRVGGMVILLALHLAIFIFLGIFVSSRVSHSITSLVILLLSWVILAFLLPNLQGLFVSNLKPLPSSEKIYLRRNILLKDIENRFQPLSPSSQKLSQAPSPKRPEVTRNWAEYLTELAEVNIRINDQHLDEQLRQAQLARNVAQISPIATFQYAMEALAGTGIEGYSSFIKQVRIYRQEFIDFIKSQDRNDPESLHIYGVREGLSQKPVDPDSVPKFKERITYGSAFNYIILLIVFNILFFMAAYISFLKCDIK
jgi:ABC-type transport system involved in multi-copper enzyme maturation permease subunit